MVMVWAETAVGPKGLKIKAIKVKQEHSTAEEIPNGKESFKNSLSFDRW